MVKPKFDSQKGLEVLLSVTQDCPDMYTALKVIYFADRLHLEKFGRLIAGDSYAAMRHGPVPSGVYDIVKFVRGDGAFCVPGAKEAFGMEGTRIVPKRPPNQELLSESDQKCLAESLGVYGEKSFSELRNLSHDEAFNSVDQNDFIDFEKLARSVPGGDGLWEYLSQ